MRMVTNVNAKPPLFGRSAANLLLRAAERAIFGQPIRRRDSADVIEAD